MSATAVPDPHSLRVAQAFLARARRHYPVEQALLYGSRSRGDARADSDVDVALVMDTSGPDARRASVELAGEAFDLMLETGLLVSPFALSKNDWAVPDSYSNPYLLRNIRRDGIPL